jgi:hypothetical protein
VSLPRPRARPRRPRAGGVGRLATIRGNPRGLRIGLPRHGAPFQSSTALHSVVTRAVIVPRRLASRPGLGSSRGLARLSGLPNDRGLVGADHVTAVGASRVFVHPGRDFPLLTRSSRYRHMFGRSRERVVATCGLFGGCTYECHGDRPRSSAQGGRRPRSLLLRPGPRASPISLPPALKQLKAVRGYPRLGNDCPVTVHSAQCNLAVSAESLTASMLQNDPQPPGRGRLRAATDCALQMVYRQQGKRHAHSTRTFVLPEWEGVYAGGCEGAPAPRGARPGIAPGESFSGRRGHVGRRARPATGTRERGHCPRSLPRPQQGSVCFGDRDGASQ